MKSKKVVRVKSKPNKRKLDKQILETWSKIVRLVGKCKHCGSTHRLQAHHIASRTHRATRYAIDNGLCLCSACHFHEKIDPEAFREMILRVVGEKNYYNMVNRSRDPTHYKTQDLETIKYNTA